MTQITKIVEATITVAPRSEIEKTRHQMYTDLKRFQTMVGSTHLFKTFQDSLEAHLEELRKANSGLVEGFAQQHADIGVRLANMTEDRDQIQQRLHAIDHAYLGSQTALGVAGDCIRDTQAVNREYQGLIKERDDQIVALKESLEANRDRVESLLNQNKASGEELIRVQGLARQYLDDLKDSTAANASLHESAFHAGSIIRANKIEIESLRGQLEARDKTIGELRKKYGRDREDLMAAEKHSDEFSEQLRDAQAVIGQQEQLIVGQRLAIADLYLAGRRVNSAVATLQRLGYTDCGGQLWKPPIGKKPDFVDYGAELREQNNGQPSR